MKISYLITCRNETDTLSRLLYTIMNGRNVEDEVIILDDFSDNPCTQRMLEGHSKVEHKTKHIQHALNNDYGSHKNFGIEQCQGDFIFQLDGDERPPDALLGENLVTLLESNPTIEAYAVPRINDFRGVTKEDAHKWGWTLTTSPTYKTPVVNWPDYQFRIFKRDYPRISFNRRLHEKVEGYSNYVCLPAEESFALYHDKTIEVQIATNLRYNQMFSADENRGHNVFGKK